MTTDFSPEQKRYLEGFMSGLQTTRQARAVAPGGFAWVVPFRRGARRFNRVGLMCQTAAVSRFGGFEL